MFWLLGSFSGVRWPEFQLALVVVLTGLAICLYYSRALDAFTFGDDAAASLGIAVPWVRLALFTTTAFCRTGGSACYALLLWSAASHIAYCQRTGWRDPDGAGGHRLAFIDSAAKFAGWCGDRPGRCPLLCRDHLPLKE